MSEDSISFNNSEFKFHDIDEQAFKAWGEGFIPFNEYSEQKGDMVNSTAHYTRGKQEAIEIIEEAIQDAPNVKAGMLQAQSLKYLLRLWLKGNAPQDAEKARWYLNRLIEHLSATLEEEESVPNF